MLVANVVLPVPLQGLFTYIIPASFEKKIEAGMRVIVQFGKKKLYTAIIFNTEEVETILESTKEIIDVIDIHPIIPPIQLKFWEWLSNYYMCTLGDVYRAAIPGALKLESETNIIINDEFQSETPFSIQEQNIFNLLTDGKTITIDQLQKKSGINNIIPHIKTLVEKGAIFRSEDIRDNFRAKKISIVRFKKQFSEDELLHISGILKKAPKQLQLFYAFLQVSENKSKVFKKELLDKSNSNATVLNELIKKDILEVVEMETNRIDYGDSALNNNHSLNQSQQKAYEEITELFDSKDTVLLHGITSAGKTEIYIHLIKDAIANGKQVLYLLPEIALTTQITERLKRIFGNQLAVYHSKFSDNERVEIWNKLLNDENCKVILGARSAIFLPFTNIGLIIVDEEHESSYKQQDPAPRYNARNSSIILANLHNAKILLGSATPSIESYYNALNDKYGLVRLMKRYENIELPTISIVNTKELRRKKQMKSILSPILIDKIKEALQRKEQIILFQNRRGFASMLECKTCSWTPHCLHCDVSLTYHKGARMMICHYCGATYPIPSLCEECKTPTLEILGYGTERVEEEVANLFPDISIARMDLDTTKGKKAYLQIIQDFEAKDTDILIGTQMVSKGLDFDNVSTVGILNADNMLNYPDFRAYERAYQLITQVSGRAGRKNKQGEVYLQTSNPGNPIINYVKTNDYDSFFNAQLEERRIFHYPPFFRLISIILKARDEKLLEAAASKFAAELKTSFHERILGPTKPPVGRVQSLFIRKILLKIENQASISKVRELINYHRANLGNDLKSILIHFDVDPL